MTCIGLKTWKLMTCIGLKTLKISLFNIGLYRDLGDQSYKSQETKISDMYVGLYIETLGISHINIDLETYVGLYIETLGISHINIDLETPEISVICRTSNPENQFYIQV